MALRSKAKSRIVPEKIEGLVRNLTVVHADASKIASRVGRARKIGSLGGIGDTSVCVIDITCCIIDCSGCRPPDLEIFENPANVLDGFLFRMPHQAEVVDAPVYYLPAMDARSALRLGHGSVKVPGGGAVDGKIIGLAGEFLDARALSKQGIAATATVIALAAKKAA